MEYLSGIVSMENVYEERRPAVGSSTAYLVLCQSNRRESEVNSVQQAQPPEIIEIYIPPDDHSKRFTIGRSMNQNLQISRTRDGKEVISRRHAEIYRRRDGYFYIQDLKTLKILRF